MNRFKTAVDSGRLSPEVAAQKAADEAQAIAELAARIDRLANRIDAIHKTRTIQQETT